MARKLNRKLENRNVVIIDGGTVPENFTGLIKRENPTHIILIDAADMKKPAGHIKIIRRDEISQYNISTHAMPLSFLIKYLEHFTDVRIILIGIQPKEMELVETVSPEIDNSITFVVDTFQGIL